MKNNLIGKRFGKYLVIAKALPRGKSRVTRWVCRCDCGTEKEQDGYVLRKGKSTRCASCSESRYKWEGTGDISKTYWAGVEARAKKKKQEFNISIDFAWELFIKQNRQCNLTQEPLIFAKQYITNFCKLQTASLDRIDSNKGYTEDNVQWVHKTINLMKRDLTQEQFINWCKKVK